MSSEWLSLIEYRNKYHVSISTLRRRIREDAIRYQLIKGKYFLYDEPVEVKTEQAPYFTPQLQTEFVETRPVETFETKSTQILLGELKAAYQRVLKEKEEQIFILREEIANQQTLIRILEEENERLKHR